MIYVAQTIHVRSPSGMTGDVGSLYYAGTNLIFAHLVTSHLQLSTLLIFAMPLTQSGSLPAPTCFCPHSFGSFGSLVQ